MRCTQKSIKDSYSFLQSVGTSHPLPPQGSSKTAAEALNNLDDAAAVTAAERILQQPAGASDTQQPAGSSGAAALAPLPRFPPASDVRVGRRLLLRLLRPSPGVKGIRGASASAMGFFGEELGAMADAPRTLDLHGVACRLQAGLYSATGGCGA